MLSVISVVTILADGMFTGNTCPNMRACGKRILMEMIIDDLAFFQNMIFRRTRNVYILILGFSRDS